MDAEFVGSCSKHKVSYRIRSVGEGGKTQVYCPNCSSEAEAALKEAFSSVETVQPDKEDRVSRLQRELEAVRAERDALRDAVRPFAGMCQVLDCRNMHDRNPTYVSVSLADGLLADEELALTGEIDDDRPIVCANASARGFPGAVVTGLVMGDFRRALAALSRPVQQPAALSSSPVCPHNRPWDFCDHAECVAASNRDDGALGGVG